MLLANIGWDLQAASQGRFVLGLGSQIKPHITKRFSMQWIRPASRMREMVQAVRAIWGTWQQGTRLRFGRRVLPAHPDDGRCSPRTRPISSEFGPPPIFLAGAGPLMTEVSGEVYDGFLCHPFTAEKYHREVTLPAAATRQAQRWPAHGGLRGSRALVRRHWLYRAGGPAVGRRHMPADRLLRLDSRLPARSGDPRLGRPPEGPQHPVKERPMGADGSPHRRRGAQHLCRGRLARGHRARTRPALRRRRSAASRSTSPTATTPTAGRR